jgi:hypothetical protein
MQPIGCVSFFSDSGRKILICLRLPKGVVVNSSVDWTYLHNPLRKGLTGEEKDDRHSFRNFTGAEARISSGKPRNPESGV